MPRSVKTHLQCDKIYNDHIIANCPQCASERILNVDQQLATTKNERQKYLVTFFRPPCIYTYSAYQTTLCKTIANAHDMTMMI